jgi:hypothetical protein
MSDHDRTAKAALRGSGGYRELRRQLLRHVAQSDSTLAQVADEATDRLRLSTT